MNFARVGLLVALGAVFAWVVPESLLRGMVFQPSKGRWQGLAQLGIDGEESWLETEDGVRLHAFFVRGSRDPDRAILFLHGNAGNASHRLPNAALMAALGTHVLVPDYRGYGLSEGEPSERGLYSDARAALAHLEGSRGIPARRVVLFGRSLGGAVAVELAAESEIGGVILEATFSSAADVANRIFFWPLGLLLGSRWDSQSRISRVRAPLLFFHGERDRVIPIALGRKLFEAAPEPKSFEVIARAGHDTVVEWGGRAYLERIRSFLDEVAPLADGSPQLTNP